MGESSALPIMWFFAPIASATALIFAWYFHRQMLKEPEGNPTMIGIAAHVSEGASAYLRQQYKVVSFVFVGLFLFLLFISLGLKALHPLVPFAFLTGGFFSGLSGFLGMKAATHASPRTAFAASISLDKGLRVAFRSGAVMGLVVVGLGLFDISAWFLALYLWGMSLREITVTMLCFGMGASTQALFARVGGGIFTKAADVGADLVGKVEAGIPEDDPRNPAVIADNVGDIVGDVAGMGADLYESYCGAILATAALGVAAFVGSPLNQLHALILPMMLAASGIMASIAGIFVVKTREGATQKQLLSALGHGVNLSAVLIVGASWFFIRLLLPEHMGILWAMISGLVSGIIIGKATEYFTSADFRPTRRIAEQSSTGPATVILEGISLGMFSTAIPVISISAAIILSYAFAGGYENVSMGLYGIGVAAVGMLSTLGITLATDAYGPIADNAGGNAEMSGLDPIVRSRTDALDSLGNTTAATGKGFAIGSAGLTAMALLSSYLEEVRIALERNIGSANPLLERLHIDSSIDLSRMDVNWFVDTFRINLMNPYVLVGLFLGAALPMVFSALTIGAVGRVARQMVEEVRRQFKEIPGLMEGTGVPDYARCVEISTRGAQKAMILPSLMAIISPAVVGLLLGVSGVMGLLVGSLASGFSFAVMLNNSGGAWDNAKKYVEAGNCGGKQSDCHRATVVGDTVGDPFKDTAGPSLNILLKLLSMVSIVMAGLVVQFSPLIQNFLGLK